MEYIVSNDRLDELVEIYLVNNLFQGIEEFVSNKLNKKTRSWMIDGKTVIVLTKRRGKKLNLWIHDGYWKLISSLFSIGDDDIKRIFQRWAINNLGLSEHINALKI